MLLFAFAWKYVRAVSHTNLDHCRDRLMPQSLSATAEYKRAFALAVYVLGDLTQAEAVASIVVLTNDKELKKLVKNRKIKSHPKWTRVLRNKAFNIDILTHLKSLKYELKQETDYWNKKRTLDEESMVIRFVKQVVFDGLIRISRFLNVGLGRLVFSYPYENIADIQQLLEQSSESLPDEYRFRKQRQVLFNRLRERFNDAREPAKQFLKLESFNQYVESVIVSRRDSEKYYPLVRECLTVLIPPEPRCVLLQTLNPWLDVLKLFHFDTGMADMAEEHAVERNRMHAVICPVCYDWVISALHLPDPASSLRLPLFSLGDRGGGEGPAPQARRWYLQQSWHNNPSTDRAVGEPTERGETPMVSKVVIAIDNIPREMIDLSGPRALQFELEPGASIIEIFDEADRDGIPLGLIYLDWDSTCDEDNPAHYKLKLEEQCMLEFLIFYQVNSAGDEERGMVKVDCAILGRMRRASAHHAW